MVAKRTARSERIKTINQARSLIVTGPMTCGPGSPSAPPMTWLPSWRRCGPAPARSSATPPAWRCVSWAGAWSFLDGQLERLDEPIVPLVTARAPGLPALYGVAHDTAAELLIAAGGHPERLRFRGRLGTPVRRHADPGVLAESRRHRLNPAATARLTTPCTGS